MTNVQNNLAYVDRILKQLDDPELGQVGLALLQLFMKTGCREFYDPDLTQIKAEHSLETAKINKIVYGPKDMEDKQAFFAQRLLAILTVIHSHYSTSLMNMLDRGIALSIPSFIHANELRKCDIHAKHIWLMSLATSQYPDMRTINSRYTLGDIQQFNEDRILYGLPKTLENTAIGAVNWLITDDSKLRTLAQENLSQSIDEYLGILKNHAFACMENGRRYPINKLIIARLDPPEIANIGNVFALSSFGGPALNPAFVHRKWNDREMRRIKIINLSCFGGGLETESELPTLTEAFRARGLTRDGKNLYLSLMFNYVRATLSEKLPSLLSSRHGTPHI